MKDKNGIELKKGDIVKWFVAGFNTSGGYPAPNISWHANDEIRIVIVKDIKILNFTEFTGIGAIERQTEIEIIGNINDNRPYWQIL